jgi:hypothetical protein
MEFGREVFGTGERDPGNELRPEPVEAGSGTGDERRRCDGRAADARAGGFFVLAGEVESAERNWLAEHGLSGSQETVYGLLNVEEPRPI